MSHESNRSETTEIGAAVGDDLAAALVGCILGTAVGDALGLPCEALSRRRQQKLFPALDRHRFLFGRGMTSDDTEHTCLVAESLIVAGGDPGRFSRSFAWKLRFWLLGLPGGVGFATLRAIFKLWIGFPPRRSGVFSAGNGAAMRSAVVGVAYGGDVSRLKTMISAATRVTHTDPKAEQGALAVALAAWLARTGRASADEFFRQFRDITENRATEFEREFAAVAESVARGESVEAFAASRGLGKGVTGYVLHTVPVGIHAWLSHPRDFRAAVTASVRCGGDADTTAAIVGGIVGAGVGRNGIPAEWLNGILEYPRTVGWMTTLGERLAETVAADAPGKVPPYFWPAIIPRNALFLATLLVHGLRRMLPPY
jgi:ADP-ribosylglycohydrolase